MFLKVRNLYKSFGADVVLKNINFGVKKGEVVCILGPSGCGKTTLLNSLGGFIKIDKGDIFLDEVEISKLSPNERKISTVFQSYGLFTHMNVFNNISYGLKFKKMSKKEKEQKTLEIMEIVGLSGLQKRMVNEISGGQQQRVALARSLIINPKLLLLDEPFSNLDKNLRILMRKEIKNLVTFFDMTTILVTHDQEDAFSMADRVILMNEGEIIQNSSPEELYNKPDSKFALEFIGKSNIIDDFFVRPENILIDDNREDFNAIIKKVNFHGTLIDYEVELIEENRTKILIISEINRGYVRKKGDRVFIKYDLTKI